MVSWYCSNRSVSIRKMKEKFESDIIDLFYLINREKMAFASSRSFYYYVEIWQVSDDIFPRKLQSVRETFHRKHEIVHGIN